MKKDILLFLLLLTIVFPVTATDDVIEINGICYQTNGTEATVIGPSDGLSSDLIIPRDFYFNGTMYTVTSIGCGAFVFCTGLTSVSIPNSVTSIGNDAFYNCSNLTSIDIPNSVTSIGDGAFYNCSNLTSIDIPDSISSIGGFAFYNCSKLATSIDIPSSITFIDNSTFEGCTCLTSVSIPNSVTSIGDRAFCLTGLTSISIPNSVISIGEWAFSASITDFIIPGSVTYIGNGAFSSVSLRNVYFLGLVPPTLGGYDLFYNDGPAVSVFVPNIALDTYIAAETWKDFTCVVGMPYAFEMDGINYCSTTKNTASVINHSEEDALYSGDIVIPDSVTFEGFTLAITGVDSNAFDGCYELSSVVIPNSVTAIGEQAFQGCTGLTSLTIGSGVKEIGAKAFNYCNDLEKVKCIGSVPPEMASKDCFSLAAYNRATLLVPRNSEPAFNAADYWYEFAHIEGWGSAGRGDVDGDGIMNIKDVTTLIDAMLGNEVVSLYFESADLNSNGRIDIGDITSLIDNLINGF